MKKEKIDEKFLKVKANVIRLIEKTNNIDELKRAILDLSVTTMIMEALAKTITKKKK